MKNDKPIDVLIIGAGPAGTALAIDLARRGLDIRIVDKAPHAFDGSRAKGLQPRTLEVLYDLDALDDILAGAITTPTCARPTGRRKRGFETSTTGSRFGASCSSRT